MFEDILSPVPASLMDALRNEEAETIGNWLQVHDEIDGFPDWRSCQLCIIGVCEGRGGIGEADQSETANSIRHQLYRLFPGDWSLKVADVGNLYAGEGLEDTYAALREMLSELLKEGVIPIVLGGSQDITYPMYRAYGVLDQTVNIAAVDNRFDLGRQNEGQIDEWNYLSYIVLQKPYRLFNFANIGYQTYLVNQEERELMEKMHFDLLRLGELRANMSLCEPLFRDSDLVSIDMSSLRASVAIDVAHPGPNGFNEEEICALARYAGISDKVSSFGIFGLKSAVTEQTNITAMLAAQVVWYFLEGVSARKGDYPVSSTKSYDRFAVLINDGEEELVFYRSPLSGRWWMEVPLHSIDSLSKTRSVLVPCTQADYDQACTNEVPDRWWRAYQKGM